MKYLGSISNNKDLVTREYADHYGVCSTTDTTQEKAVTIGGLTALHEGVSIHVKFTNRQSYNGAPTLNVNNLGSIAIKKYGTTDAAIYEWEAGEIVNFRYDGTYWVIEDGGKLPASTKFAASQSIGGPADKTISIPTGAVDSTSTSTAFTATVSGITELRDGVLIWLTNGVVTSAEGCTLDVNNLGAKPLYNSIAAATATTTTFNINYTMLFIYNSTRVTGGCWDMVYGYDSNTTYSPVKLGFGYTTCSTAAATVAKTASLSSYSLTTNGIVSVRFANDVPASATLNINSKGAKAIYFNNAAITAGVIKAGDTATFIYSTYYRLISIDRWATDISKKYEKPSGGIPKTDLAQAVQTSLGKADTALQSVPNTYRTAAVQDVIDAGKQAKITASGILKGNGSGGVSAAVAGTDYIAPSEKGAANGVATLGNDSKVPGTQLPLWNGGTTPGGTPVAYQIAPTVVTETAPTAITLADNTVYYMTDVSSLTLTYPSSGHWECFIVMTTASSGTVTVTLPASSYIGDAPSFGNGETWEISIRDGVVVAGKAVAAS